MADIEGLDELLKDLGELPRTVGRKLIARSLRKAAKPVQDRIIATAPDDPTTPTSRIADNIDINVTEQTSEGAIALVGPTKHGFFAGFAEFGTAHQSAKPFMAPAFDEEVDNATAIIAEDLGAAIERELKKL